ncbi:MAG: hypothetical protein K6T34_06615 [Thermoflavifilum sp.]|nr:hypothetical protein [Thermoflavifilum sp.]
MQFRKSFDEMSSEILTQQNIHTRSCAGIPAYGQIARNESLRNDHCPNSG